MKKLIIGLFKNDKIRDLTLKKDVFYYGLSLTRVGFNLFSSTPPRPLVFYKSKKDPYMHVKIYLYSFN